jgi:hypothetical protein
MLMLQARAERTETQLEPRHHQLIALQEMWTPHRSVRTTAFWGGGNIAC